MSSEANRMLASLLRRLADSIEAGSEADLQAILGKRSVDQKAKRGDKKSPPRSTNLASGELKDIVDRLLTFDSRDAGGKFLDGLHLTKANFEQLARWMDLSVQREDTSDRLRDKVIEASIGYRLRSQAVQGLRRS